MMPRIGLNAHLLSLDDSYRGAGVSRYIHSLLTYLPQVDDDSSYVAFLGPVGRIAAPPHQEASHHAGWDERVSRWRTHMPLARILWEQLVQPWAARRENLDLLHVPVYVGPVTSSCPIVVTIHDLSFYLYPDLLRPFNRTYLQNFTRRTVAHAEGIIAVSESTRNDIVRILGVPEEKVTVIPNGVGQEMHPINDREQIAALRRRYDLPERMILFLGTLEPRKNIPTLLEAFGLLCRNHDADHRLVVAGGKGWYYGEIYATAERLGLRNKVIFPGYIPQSQLALWYNAADLFVYPSLYEGFGLPPLEALACGTPAIVSDVSSLPEVVGEAGLVVNPLDAQALAEAMYSVLGNPARHRALREAGLLRAKAFSWRTTASKTAKLYHRIVGEEIVPDA